MFPVVFNLKNELSYFNSQKIEIQEDILKIHQMSILQEVAMPKPTWLKRV